MLPSDYKKQAKKGIKKTLANMADPKGAYPKAFPSSYPNKYRKTYPKFI